MALGEELCHLAMTHTNQNAQAMWRLGATWETSCGT